MSVTQSLRASQLLSSLCLAVLAGPVVAATASAAAAIPPARAVDSVAVTVSDMERAVTFYTGVLGFDTVADTEVVGEQYEHLYGVFGARIRIVKLKLGDEYLQLEQFINPRGRPIPADSQSNDRAFQHVAIIVSDMDRAYAWLRDHKVEHASSGPQLLPASNPDAGGIAAFYFRDPDGHSLEVLHFPAGKGNPKWQSVSQRLFLGIDHTAIVVADTDASLSFYRDALGFRVAGHSENFGTEQEHLNNVFGARLRITALRAQTGPGVELLEYLAPRNGRAMPADTRANDLWSWHLNLTADLSAADREARRRHFTYVSPGSVTLTTGPLQDGLMLRDPDGHALLLHSP
jgi:catechol 2,3-dioxygenase-like lactoylglutathione lyase family enzyme